MVKVKGGKRSEDNRKPTRAYSSHLCQIEHEGVVFFCSNSSKLESGKYLVLLTAIARQCTMHRTVIMNDLLDEAKAEKLTKKWIKTVPIKYIK